ncbi:MAG: hypothetical protein KJ597_00040 [Nanoarchaeota archaeon]|nr:hypothetical protein [Nanoarchaeota archaeon]MBU1621943.1 hypothetical protein [Nanoarchaeota archaeon]
MMPLTYQLQIELFPFQRNNFKKFLLQNSIVKSFQRIKRGFLVHLNPLDRNEYLVFLKMIKKIYSGTILKEIRPCQAKCRDGTNCLNKVRDRDYCCKHKPSLQKNLSTPSSIAL